MSRLGSIKNIGVALSNRNYRLYTIGNFISMVGMWMHKIAAGWLVWELTGSGAWLGILAFADLFPLLVIGPIAGAIADRWDRLRLTALTQMVGAVQASVLAVLAFTGLATVEILIVLTVLQGAANAFAHPARLAIVSSLVPREHMTSAIALNGTVFNTARFIGPAIAGVIIATIGTPSAFLGNALSYGVFLVALAMIRLPRREQATSGKSSLLSEIAGGVRYAASHRSIATLLVLCMASGLGVRPLVDLLPGFAEDVFAAGAPGLAMLTSSIGLGAVAGGLWLGTSSEPARLPQMVVVTSALLGLSVIAFTMVDRMALAVPAIIVAGFFLICSGVGAQTLIQLTVTPAMRARVLSLFALIIVGGPALGALAMGFVSEWFGLGVPVAAGGVGIIATAAWARSRVPTIIAALALPSEVPPGPARP